LEGRGITNKQYVQLRYNFHPRKRKTIQTGQEEIFSKAEISLFYPRTELLYKQVGVKVWKITSKEQAYPGHGDRRS